MSLPSITSVSTRSSASSSFDYLQGMALVKFVENERLENLLIEAENILFENFLLAIDPASIANMEHVLEVASKKRQSTGSQASFGHHDTSSSLFSIDEHGSKAEVVVVRATPMVKMNLEQRIELAQKAIEDIQQAVVDTENSSSRIRKNLMAALEQTALQISETDQMRASFEQSIIIKAIDPITNRIPGEKVVRFMEEWLRSTESKIEKLRMDTTQYKNRNLKLRTALIQKEELGESLHPVDFERIRIDNDKCIRLIEHKNMQTQELKRISGNANLMLNVEKQFGLSQLKEIACVQKAIVDQGKLVLEIEKDANVVELEVDVAARTLRHMQNLVENYTVPSVMDYVHKIAELKQLQKMVKVWARRVKIQQIELTSAKTRVRRLMGNNKYRTVIPTSKDSSEIAMRESLAAAEFLRSYYSI